ncbi:MAG: 4-(cytidine 5'-diphospho)-2-C-methyl-D-erythritol kinase [Acidimicrobiales bacterium]|jgi:4-diphosphocytidyl-2-C-methyl-D-erythritol kinase|nr:4-(cytidine 5'-diphospho)-2-C-methyl-D-erythritol kinase [Acidimicrobiales bacterium]MDP6297969.1 4-(cytidine 5'-diphospho)-2-C-methyl-D-erythritol kinase [Acidimicrobiales bacterium]HJM27918.1 4-(cytidine 5'-diphospho)-2-C-methyl-D-erythritol kinase [Acidimicrobiales bacterium]HJM97936.1 4-(cytidine 5'-diphospho)-2-C-methyl-D-erythritol kinase [Acidimicrobiales bacterium]
MIELTSPAKLTLSLRITGVRSDGLHTIESEMVTIDFADTLTIEDEGNSVTYTGNYPITPPEEEDLVLRALKMVGAEKKVTVIKNIPPGGGLGGGSANAASIFRWARFTDEIKAVDLGSDIPFNIRGGHALVKGIGEEIKNLKYEKRVFTLLIPPFGCSTADVYETWDEMGSPKGTNGNDLELAALKVEPHLWLWRDKLEKHSGQTPRLAGSGSTWFVEGSYPGEGFIVTQTTRASTIRSTQTQ